MTCELRSSRNDVFNQPVLAKDISDDKPTAALVKIRNIVGDIGREAWAKRARTTAILGNCPKTVASMRSGVTHWCSYLEITKGSEAEPFPVDMQDILGWSLAFRCIGTFSNYLGVLHVPLGASLHRLGTHRFVGRWVQLQSVCGTVLGQSMEYRERY